MLASARRLWLHQEFCSVSAAPPRSRRKSSLATLVCSLTRSFTKSVHPVPNAMLGGILESAVCGKSVPGSANPCRAVEVRAAVCRLVTPPVPVSRWVARSAGAWAAWSCPWRSGSACCGCVATAVLVGRCARQRGAVMANRASASEHAIAKAKAGMRSAGDRHRAT